MVARNRAAAHKFHIISKMEAGLALEGSEVKSLRAGKVSLAESYARLRAGEAFLVGMHIDPYEKATIERPDPRRERKLLLSRAEVRRIEGQVRQKGFTLVPLSVYFKGPWAKVEIALARGKGRLDRRQELKRRTQEREMARAVSRRRGKK